MRKHTQMIVAFVFLFPLCIRATSAQDKHIFTGFSFSDIRNDRDDQVGWNVEFGMRDSERLQLVVDASGTYASLWNGTASTHVLQLGPQFSMFPKSKVTPFFRGMLGVYHSAQPDLLYFPIPDSDLSVNLGGGQTAALYSFGGGIDWKIKGKLRLRLIQADFLHKAGDQWENNQVRLSSGLVFSF